jgi:nucleoside-diphosphate-sugar epimerase
MNDQNEKVLVTGVSGFIGRAVALALLKRRWPVLGAVRCFGDSNRLLLDNRALTCLQIGNINGKTKWQYALEDVQTVVHCAARSHVMRERLDDHTSYYSDVNVAGTLRLAEQAAAAGVKRLIFLSSIKVSGEITQQGKAFTETSGYAPQDPYAKSKVEAEQALFALAQQVGMEVVIIRPPLVVGPGVKGNFANMIKWITMGIPLPLGAVNNQRSLISLDNLVSLVLLCVDRGNSQKAANQVFVVADGEDVSTTMLLQKIARAAGYPNRLLPVPVALLRVSAALLGKIKMADRVLGNLQIDATKVRAVLGWRPVITLDDQLSVMFDNKNTTN